jgi:hypothetical protein
MPFKGTGQRAKRDVRWLRSSDRRAITQLLRVATPPALHGMNGSPYGELDPNWDDLFREMLSDSLAGRVTHRWVLQDEGRIMAVMMVRAHRFLGPHQVAIQVHPDDRGRVEDDLVVFALRDLARFPGHEIRAAATSTHPELTVALEAHGFRFHNGLMSMALIL